MVVSNILVETTVVANSSRRGRLEGGDIERAKAESTRGLHGQACGEEALQEDDFQILKKGHNNLKLKQWETFPANLIVHDEFPACEWYT